MHLSLVRFYLYMYMYIAYLCGEYPDTVYMQITLCVTDCLRERWYVSSAAGAWDGIPSWWDEHPIPSKHAGITVQKNTTILSLSTAPPKIVSAKIGATR
jgi:hypothetical protein